MSKGIFFKMVFGLEVHLDQLRTVTGSKKTCSKHGDIKPLFECGCDFDKVEFCPLCGTMLVKEEILVFSKGFIRLADEVGLNPDMLYKNLIRGEQLPLMSEYNKYSYSIYRINNTDHYGSFRKDYDRYAIGHLVLGLDVPSERSPYVSANYFNDIKDIKDIKKLNENLKDIADLLGLDLNSAGCFISIDML